ncbi:MAG TPA: hypothetical protein VGC76_11605 [Pyrinomonadaceae bacterium]|jgi:hypothetical protein
MDDDYSERQSEFTGKRLIYHLKVFLQKLPIEKIETIKGRIGFEQNLLYPLIIELIEDLKKSDSNSDLPDKWQAFDEKICVEIDYFLQTTFQDFIYFIVLQTLLDSKNTPLNEKYRKQLLSKYSLTPKKVRQAILDTLEKTAFREEIKRGGKKGFWNEFNKLQFLSLYNRFLIVIKNARKDLKLLIKKGKSELSSKREILIKYNIPETLIKSAFSLYDAPKETALDWVKQKLKLKFKDEYLRDILTEARKIWLSRSRGLISQKTLNENPKIQLILIDINFHFGVRYYAVTSIDKVKMRKLKYNSLAKKLTDSVEFKTDEDFEEFLIWMTF